MQDDASDDENYRYLSIRKEEGQKEDGRAKKEEDADYIYSLPGQLMNGPDTICGLQSSTIIIFIPFIISLLFRYFTNVSNVSNVSVGRA